MSATDTRHTLLLAMVADVERLREQAERIKALRREKERRDGRKISQETAAHEVGVSSRTYRTWEGTGATLQFDNLKALAEYYGTTTHFIEHGKRIETPSGIAASDQLATLTRMVNELSAQLQELRGETAATAAEVLQLLDDRLPPSAESRRRRPA